MPTYQYACTVCGERLEAVQSFTDPPLTDCPACTGALRKVFSAVGVVFKGSGFYKTDSRSAPKSDGNAAKKADGDSAKKADAGTTASESGGSAGSAGSTGSGGSTGSSSSAGKGSGSGGAGTPAKPSSPPASKSA